MAREHGGANKGSRGAGLGGASGSNMGGRRGTSSRGTQGNTGRSGRATATSEGQRKKKPSVSVMRESTWNNMTKGERLKEYGTTSYAKYKAGKKASNIRGTSRTNIQMRGRG